MDRKAKTSQARAGHQRGMGELSGCGDFFLWPRVFSAPRRRVIHHRSAWPSPAETSISPRTERPPPPRAPAVAPCSPRWGSSLRGATTGECGAWRPLCGAALQPSALRPLCAPVARARGSLWRALLSPLGIESQGRRQRGVCAAVPRGRAAPATAAWASPPPTPGRARVSAGRAADLSPTRRAPPRLASRWQRAPARSSGAKTS